MAKTTLMIAACFLLFACGGSTDEMQQELSNPPTLADCLAQPDPNPVTSYNEHLQYTIDGGQLGRWPAFCSRYCTINVGNTCYTFVSMTARQMYTSDDWCGPDNTNWNSAGGELMNAHDSTKYMCGCDSSQYECWHGGS